MFLSVIGAKAGPITANRRTASTRTKSSARLSWACRGSLPGRRRRCREIDDSRAARDEAVDKASTALMSAVRHNELIKVATLTIRKVGKTPLEYLTIKIEDGR